MAAFAFLFPKAARMASGLSSTQAALGAPPVALNAASGKGPIRLYLCADSLFDANGADKAIGANGANEFR